ncbi:MAG: radical SAM protein [bacterium]|nr:radical SAM protein [bacterium]
MDKIKIHEIYRSVQGESTHVGRPCTFVRTSGCKLRCTWCDTKHAYHEGSWMDIKSILNEVRALNIPLVEVTGGEPMEQDLICDFMQALLDEGFEVLLETGGHILCDNVPLEVRKIIDMKCPASKMERKNHYGNLELLQSHDEVKFVIQDRNDFDWSANLVRKYDLSKRAKVLFSPVYDLMDPSSLVEWILNSGLDVRFQIQIHKVIWDPQAKGV